MMHPPVRWWPRTRLVATTVIVALIVLAMAIALRFAVAAELGVPDYPPARQACAPGWQSAARVVGLEGDIAYILEAAYDPALGIGRLVRRSLGAGIDAVKVGPPLWDAAAVLDAGMRAGTSVLAARRIFTVSASGQTVPFEWERLDADARAALEPDADGLGQARLAFLRGEREREGAPFRRRTSLLGEIVHSRPLVVSAPSRDGMALGAPGYADFHRRYRERQKLVWVGAGDGMLHAFNWDDGSERFAYAPHALLPAMHRLASSDRVGGEGEGSVNSRVAVDGAPGQGEVLIDGQWRSALAAGMGMSARGLFALDVTDPAQDPSVLWEFTERDDAAMGHVQAPPVFIKLRWQNSSTASYRYFALTSNGFNASDGGADGVLFLLALDKAPAAPWRHGENYYRLRAHARDQDAVNALAAPAVTLNADGSARYAYAGDLQGAMWRFNLENVAAGEADAEVLFRASASDGAAQAIAEAARVVFAPGGGYLVLFGTGRAIDTADFDVAGFTQQSFYAVRDSDARPIAHVAGREALAERRLTGLGGAEGLHITGSRFDFNGGGKAVRHGWYFDFSRSVQDGERIAAAPALAGPAVIVSTSAPGNDRCAPTVRSYVLDSLTGVPYERTGLPALGYLNGGGGDGPVTGRAVVSKDGSVPLLLASMTPADADAPMVTPTGATRALSSIRLIQFTGADEAELLDSVLVSRPAGRLSWREIVNWPELHRAAVPAAPR